MGLVVADWVAGLRRDPPPPPTPLRSGVFAHCSPPLRGRVLRPSASVYGYGGRGGGGGGGDIPYGIIPDSRRTAEANPAFFSQISATGRAEAPGLKILSENLCNLRLKRRFPPQQSKTVMRSHRFRCDSNSQPHPISGSRSWRDEDDEVAHPKATHEPQGRNAPAARLTSAPRRVDGHGRGGGPPPRSATKRGEGLLEGETERMSMLYPAAKGLAGRGGADYLPGDD